MNAPTAPISTPPQPPPIRNSPLPLTPLLSQATADLLTRRELLQTLVHGLGSPLNIVLPQQVSANVDDFLTVLRDAGVSGSCYFAHKANRSTALVRELAATRSRIDVASTAELQRALGAGFAPDRIMATGPKNPEFLWLALRSGVTVNVDSVGELELVGSITARHGLVHASVLVRLSGFTTQGATVLSRPSRFGVPEADLPSVFDALDRLGSTVRLVGFAYHLDTVAIVEKARAFDACLRALQAARRRGHSPRVVDIGGGFGVNYLADGSEWESFTSALAESTLGQRDPVAWQGAGYGLRNESGRLRGSIGLYPAHRPTSGPAYLAELLRANAPTLGLPLGRVLSESMYDLWIEPGRALLDQCGAVVTRVLEVRPCGVEDAAFVRLDLNAGDISLEEHGVHFDPILVPGDDGNEQGPGAGYLIGNLCLEADFISRRKIWFRSMPQVGDLLVFPNTAGYFMDFSADHALDQPIARKVAVTRTDNHWSWRLDDEYWPTDDAAREALT